MALLERLSRALAADLHDLLDRIEDPQTLLAQALRELEAEIDEQERAAARLSARITQDETRLGRMDERIAELDRGIDLSLSAEREDLAREVVREKLLVTRQRTALREKLLDARGRHDRHGAQLEEYRATLGDLRDRFSSVENAADPYEPIVDWAGRSGGTPRARPTASAAADDGRVAGVSAADIDVALLAERAARAAS